MSDSLLKVPRVGEAWPEQGGVYAGIMRGENGKPDYYLIVPIDPLGQHDAIAWAGSRYVIVANACSDCDGQANTHALIQTGDEYLAAQWAHSLAIDGHTDFYLPSRRELRLCWVNAPELFLRGWHWTSTQYSRSNAWGQYFDSGSQDGCSKSFEARARAVRRVYVTQD